MLFVRRYQDANIFLTETRQELEVYELEHAFPLWAASVLAQNSLGNSYCGALWNGSKLVFAIVAFDHGNAFATLLMDKTIEARESIAMLVEDICSAPVVVKRILGDPALAFVKDSWRGKIEFNSKVWNYIFTADDLSSLNDKSNDDFYLRQTSVVELPLLMKWTTAFSTDDCEQANASDEDDEYFHCAQQIQEGNAYFWCHRDKGPVAMVWKRRPLSRGCSIGYVYTPPMYRGRGYGGAMMASLACLLLQDFTYITLLVDGERNPDDNMYTRIGYRVVGERCEYLVLT